MPLYWVERHIIGLGAIGAIAGLWVAFHTPAQAARCPIGTLTGDATKVASGQSIMVGGVPIHLLGLVVPDKGQTGGKEAQQAMIALVGNKELSCRLDGKRLRDGCTGTCFLDQDKDGKPEYDIGADMVLRGFARDCNGTYDDQEAKAKEAGLEISRYFKVPRFCTGKAEASSTRAERQR